MPSYVSHGWRVKKPFSELLPEMDAQGERRELSGWKKKRKVKQCEIEWGQIRVMEDERRKKRYRRLQLLRAVKDEEMIEQVVEVWRSNI